jgi:uncharacterized cofD-like protein
MRGLKKWLQPGIRVKRWLVLLAFGLMLLGMGFAQSYVIFYEHYDTTPTSIQTITLGFLPRWWRVLVAATVGIGAVVIALYELNNSIVQPIVAQSPAHLVDIVAQHNRLQKGLRVVAIGGGTGLPSVLRGMKTITTHITAIVTMADDGGSSGRLREEMGVPPPGDLRNNIAALANDEEMMTRLFQYRFGEGGLSGHSFGNLFLIALAEITGNMDSAVLAASRLLAITGRVLPSTLYNVNLGADVRRPDGRLERVIGESNIPKVEGRIERVFLDPPNAQALPEVKQAILNADLIVIGPGSLYTSILPNLLVRGVLDALKVTAAQVVYVCNIAEQPGETDGYHVGEHIAAIEKQIGQGIIDIVLANNVYPPRPKGDVTRYVQPAPEGYPVLQHYTLVMADLTNDERPWRHDPIKLVEQLLKIRASFEIDKSNKSLSQTA